MDITQRITFPDEIETSDNLATRNSDDINKIIANLSNSLLLFRKPKPYFISNLHLIGINLDVNQKDDISTIQNVESKQITKNILKNFNELERLFELTTLECNIDKNEIKDIKIEFYEISEILSELPFIQATFELLQNKAFKFTFLFEKNKLLMISKTIQNENEKYLIGYSLFINQELISSNVSTIKEFTQGFIEYLKMQN